MCCAIESPSSDSAAFRQGSGHGIYCPSWASGIQENPTDNFRKALQHFPAMPIAIQHRMISIGVWQPDTDSNLILLNYLKNNEINKALHAFCCAGGSKDRTVQVTGIFCGIFC
jgi:hypothetical protein